MKTSLFAVGEIYYGNNATMRLQVPRYDRCDMSGNVTKFLYQIWEDYHRYEKAGVMLGEFFSQGVAQLNLFGGNAPKESNEALMKLTLRDYRISRSSIPDEMRPGWDTRLCTRLQSFACWASWDVSAQE